MKKIMLLLTIIMLVIGIDEVSAIAKGNKYGVQVVGDNVVVDSKYSFTPRFISGVTTTETNCREGLSYYDKDGNCTISQYAYNNYEGKGYTKVSDDKKFYILYKNVGRYFDSNNNEIVVDMKITLESIDFGKYGGKSARFGFATSKIGVQIQGEDTDNEDDHLDRSSNGTFKIQYYKNGTSQKINIPSMISYTDIDIEILGIGTNNKQAIYVNNIDGNTNQHLDVVKNKQAITDKVFGAYYNGCSISGDKYKITCRDGNTKMDYDERKYASLIRNKQVDFDSYSLTDDYFYFVGNKNLTAKCTNSAGELTHANDVNCYTYGSQGFIGATYDSNGLEQTVNPVVRQENASDELKETLMRISTAGIVTVLYNNSPITIKSYGWYTGFENPGFLRVESKGPVKKILEMQENGTEKEVINNELEIDSNLVGKEVKYKIQQQVPNLSKEWYYSEWKLTDELPDELDINIDEVEITDNKGNNVKSMFDISFDDDNLLTIKAKLLTLTNLDFYPNLFTVIVPAKINNGICGKGSDYNCDPSETENKNSIKNTILINKVKLTYTYSNGYGKTLTSDHVETRFQPYDCENQLQIIKDSSESDIEKISDIYYLYSNFPENNNLMNFNYESGSWNFSNTSCEVVACGANPSSMLSCENGIVESSPVGTNRNPRVCYADRYSTNIGSYYYEDLSAYCGYKIEYSLPFKPGVTVESGQLLWKTLSNIIGKVKISYVCEASYDYSDDSRMDNQIESDIKGNKRIDQNRILSSIMPTFNIEWESSTKTIISNYLFVDELIEPTVECVNKKCYVRWNSNVDDIDLYYGSSWFVKSLNGILFASGDPKNQIDDNGLPIAIDEKTTNTSKSATLTVNMESNETKMSCPYNVKNNILKNDGNSKEYNFAFRVIDTSNPFPGIEGNSRNAGTNWCETSLIGRDSSDGSYIIGDLNGDGEIDANDLNPDYFRGDSSEYKGDKADLNGDGDVTYSAVCNETNNTDYCLLDSYINKNINYCKGNAQNSIIEKYIENRPNSSSNTPMYSITLTPADISEIRKYNQDHGYNEFNMKCENQNEKCTSNFISDWMDGKIEGLNSNSFDLNAWCMNDRILNKKWCDNMEVTE